MSNNVGGTGRIRWDGGWDLGGEDVEEETFGSAKSSTGGGGGGADGPGSPSLKYSAIWRRSVELRGPLSCCTAKK